MASIFEQWRAFSGDQQWSILGEAFGGIGVAAGQLSDASAARSRSLYKASVLAQENEILNLSAAQISLQADVLAEERMEEARQTIGSQLTALAANGVVVNQDDALTLIAQTARVGTADALTYIFNAQNEVAQIRMQQENNRLGERLLSRQADDERLSSLVSAGGSLLTSAGRVSDKWKAYSTATERR